MTTEESNEGFPGSEERKKLITAVALGLVMMIALGASVYSCNSTSKLQGQVDELETELKQATQALQSCQEDLIKTQKLVQTNAEMARKTVQEARRKTTAPKKSKPGKRSK